MHRTPTLVLVRAAAFALPALLACASQQSTTDTGSNEGTGTQSGTNGTTGTDGNSTTGTDGNSTTGTDGNSTTGTNGSSTTGTDGNSTTGTNGTTDTSADGGGGNTTASADGGSSKRVCAVAGPDVIADFEDDTETNVASNGFTGIWYDFADTADGAATPTLTIAASTDPMPACNKYAMHTTEGLVTTAATYAGTRGDFLAHQTPAGSTTANSFPPPYNINGGGTTFDGISFDIMAGTGGAPSLTFEVVTQDSQPTTSGGTATGDGADEFNNRGWMLSTSSAQTEATTIGTAWQTVYVPFALLVPDFLPSGCTAGVFCQAPVFDPTQALGIQFVENPGESPQASYDIWVDNISFYTGTQGLTPPSPPNNVAPTFADKTLGSCVKPTGATGNDLQWAYKNWYSRFVVAAGNGLRVQRPENNDDTVSEGIGYGMLIAVYMNDPTLFAGLWNYWQANEATGLLMTWDIPGGQGSATDADQDAAFALIEAGKKFNNATYTSQAATMVKNIWSAEFDPTTKLPTGGSNYGNSTSAHVTDPSYFAPAYYPTFAQVDPGDPWASAVPAVYTALNNIVTQSSVGLVPAWCADNCTELGENTGGASDETYQYDAHRVPWRVGLDYCWNGTASAKSFLANLIGFFNGLSASTASSGGGIGQLMDLYNLNGTPATGAAPNSMSLIGSAGVGAMTTSDSSFVNSAWQFVLDGENRALLDVSTTGGNSGYSYFNATVGLLTALSMSGNLYPM